MPKINKKMVDSAVGPTNGKNQIFYWDDDLKGFGLRVTKNGAKAYVLQYRTHSGKSRRPTLGKHGALTPSQARDLAKQKLGLVAFGKDPALDKHNAKTAPTMDDLAGEYISKHAIPHKSEKSAKSDKQLIDRLILPALAQKKVADILHQDIEVLILSKKDAPYAANRLRALLSKMFNLAIVWGWRENNPATHVTKFPEHQREVWLDEVKLSRLIDVLSRHSNRRSVDIVMMLILTGARRSEVFKATWEQFDLDAGVWIKQAHYTKQRKYSRTPLSGLAIDLVKSIYDRRQQNSEYLFPGNVPGKPITDIKNFWSGVRKSAEIPNVRPHDLRHTFASHLASKGLSLAIIGKLLGHTQLSTTQRYAHLADHPVRQATNEFGDIVIRASKAVNTKGQQVNESE